MPLLQTTTAEGALKGMVTARAPHELEDQEVAYLQDAIINQPGFVSRRGAIQGATAITAANVDSQRPIAICPVTDPAGVQKIGVFYLKDTGTATQLWVAVFTPALVFIQKHILVDSLNTILSYPQKNTFVQVVPAIDGSVIISVRHRYDRQIGIGTVSPPTPWATHRILKWYGGCPTTSMTSTGGFAFATVAATEGSTTVTGAAAEIAKIAFPGLVLTNLGVVSYVSSTTSVELLYPSGVTAAASSRSSSIVESLSVARSRGKVSCTAGVLSGATGYGTKFTEARDRMTTTIASGYSLFDITTMKLLQQLDFNTPAPAVNDTTLGTPTTSYRSATMKNYLLWASQTVSDYPWNRYTGYNFNGRTPKSVVGAFWATYKGYMLSFNGLIEYYPTETGDQNTTSRAYVHGPRFPEIMDHSANDGDWFDVVSTRPGDMDGVAVQSGNEAVIFCKGQETFALTGNNPDDFTLSKIADDGALSFESTASWKGLPIWLGKTGIWMYNGPNNEAVNIVNDTLGQRWKELVKAFDREAYNTVDSGNYLLNQARCFVYKDHLFVNITNTGNAHSIYTDGVARTSNTMQLMIYLPTMACTFLTNFNWQCFTQIGRDGYVILPQSGSTTHYFFPVDNLFTQGVATTDAILTTNSYDSGTLSTSVGPWFHIESRASDIGDGLLKKNWKQLAIEFKETNTKRMFLDTVAGLNTTAVRAALPYTGTGAFLAARVKFRTRNQYMRFRLYEDINNRPDTLTLGAWQWAFKPARRGAV